MAETVAIDCPPVAVSASALALHLDVSRTYVGKLEAEGVIQRQGAGFPLDQSRIAYLRYLRRERRQSPHSEADAEHVAVKTEMLKLQLMEKRRELVRRARLGPSFTSEALAMSALRPEADIRAGLRHV